jgi:hypothetical protein
VGRKIREERSQPVSTYIGPAWDSHSRLKVTLLFVIHVDVLILGDSPATIAKLVPEMTSIHSPS